MKIPLIVGNWKMNLLDSESKELARLIREFSEKIEGVRVVLAPSFTSLYSVKQILLGSKVSLGSQNFYYQEKGAYTGEVSSDMVKEAGCEYVIVGHSERRQVFGETDELINNKIICALEKDLSIILCVGESQEQRNAGKTFEVVQFQINKALTGVKKDHLNRVFIAYEPIWAIGTGKNATVIQVAEVHRFIREIVEKFFSGNEITPLTILYGGSVTSKNCAEFLKNHEVDGALVGGASLNIDSFCDIIGAAQSVRNFE